MFASNKSRTASPSQWCGSAHAHASASAKSELALPLDPFQARLSVTHAEHVCSVGLTQNARGYRQSLHMAGGLLGQSGQSLSSLAMTVGRSCWLFSSSVPSVTSSRCRYHVFLSHPCSASACSSCRQNPFLRRPIVCLPMRRAAQTCQLHTKCLEQAMQRFAVYGDQASSSVIRMLDYLVDHHGLWGCML